MKKIFAGNWKLNKTPKETDQFFQKFKQSFEVDADLQGSDKEILFFPPAISLATVSGHLSGHAIKYGVQNIYFEKSGAFTGENSVLAAKELGCSYVLIGHSERRQFFHEVDQELNKKVKITLGEGLIPMICIGETLSERENGQTKDVLFRQLKIALSEVSNQSHFVVAYEPVWAIGTGKIAGKDQVQETHGWIQSWLEQNKFSGSTPILYGGSVKPDNSKELLAIPYVSGFLIGGASLEVESFLKICKA